MFVHLPRSVQPLEILWFLIGAIGFAHSAPQLWRFWTDQRNLWRDGVNGGDNILAALYLGVCAAFGAIHIVIMGTGLITMLIAPASRPQQPVTPTGAAITAGLVIIALASDYGIWWLAYSRLRLHNYLRRVANTARLAELTRGERPGGID